MEQVEQRIGMAKYGIDMILGPRRVDHKKYGAPQRKGVIVHEEAIISKGRNVRRASRED